MRLEKIGIFCLALIMCVCTFTACNGSEYKKALKLMESGSYEEAETIFTQLGDYKDSTEMILECKYQSAQQFFNGEKYDNAVEIFKDLGDYKDSTDMVDECRYLIAQEYFNSKNFTEAIKIFTDLGDYKDCNDMVIECKYLTAQEYLKMENFTEAVEIFKDLGDYKDCADLVYDCNWEIVFDYYRKNYYDKNYNESDVEISYSISIIEDEIHIAYYENYKIYTDDNIRLYCTIKKENINFAEILVTSHIDDLMASGKATVDLSKYKAYDSLTWEDLGLLSLDSDIGRKLGIMLNSEIETITKELFDAKFGNTYILFEESLQEIGSGITLKDLGIG